PFQEPAVQVAVPVSEKSAAIVPPVCVKRGVARLPAPESVPLAMEKLGSASVPADTTSDAPPSEYRPADPLTTEPLPKVKVPPLNARLAPDATAMVEPTALEPP